MGIRALAFVLQPQHRRMFWVNFKNRLHLRCFLTSSLKDARQIAAHIVLVGNNTGRRIGQAMGHAHIFNLFAQHRLDFFSQRLVFAGSLLGLLFFRRIFQSAQIKAAFGDRLQGFAVKFGQIADNPFIDAVGEQQHLDALLAENFQMRAVSGRGKRLGGHVINLLLPIFHAANVVGKRDVFFRRIGMRRSKAQQFGDAFLVSKILADAFFEDTAELLPEAGIFFLFGRLFTVGQSFKQAQHFLDAAAANRFDVLRFLQNFARDVERQIVRIDDAAHEAQIQRHQFFGIIHDEHAAHVQLDAVARVAVPQVKGRVLRNIKQLRVFLPPLNPGVYVGQGIFKIMCDVLVKRLVLLIADFRAGPRPERRSLIDRLFFAGLDLFLFLLIPLFLLHQDRQRDVIGILANDLAQFPAGEQFILTLAQVQRHVGAAPSLFDRLDRKFTLPRRLPFDCLISRQPGTERNDRYFVGNDVGGIKADAELANQVRIFGLIARQRCEKFARAGFGDGAQMFDGFLARESDPVIRDSNRTRRLVEGYVDFQIGIIAQQRRFVQRRKTQFVAGVGSVGNQFAQENFLVAVQRMDHQVEQLLDLSLEAKRLLILAHAVTPLIRIYLNVVRISPR